MAVQIPTVKRMDPGGPAPTPKVNAELPDFTRAMDVRQRAAERFGDQAVDAVAKIEDDAANTEALKREIEYERLHRSLLDGDPSNKKVGLRYMDGDPTQLYRDFDDQMSKKFEELVNDPNLSDVARKAVMKRLADRASSLDMQKMAAYGMQQTKYEDGIARDAVKSRQMDLLGASEFVRPEDPASFAEFDKAVGQIRDINIRHGMKFGSVTPNENGKTFYVDDDGKPQKVDIGPSVDLEIRKNLNDGIYKAIDNLVNAGQIEKADAIRKRYADIIDPYYKKELSKNFERAEIDRKATVLSLDLSKGDEVTKGLDPVMATKIRDKALEIKDTRDRHKQMLLDRDAKRNYNVLAGQVIARMTSDQPYAGLSELQKDPTYIQVARNLNPKQLKAVHDLVARPKESRPESVQKMQNLLFGSDQDHPDIRRMSPEDFGMYLSGLSEKDQARYRRTYERLNTETTGEEAQRYKTAGIELEKQLAGLGYFKTDMNGRIHLGGKNRIDFMNMRNEMYDWLDKNQGPMSPKEVKDFVRQFAVSKAENMAFAPPKSERFEGSARKTVPPATAAPPPTSGLVKGKTRVEWNRQLQKELGRPPSRTELDDYIKNQD